MIETRQTLNAVLGASPLSQPQLIQDRRCMDGGVSGSGTHCDRLAGSTRALVISLVGGDDATPGGRTMSEYGQTEE